MDFYKDLAEELTTFFLTQNPNLDIETLISPLPPHPPNYPEKNNTPEKEARRANRHRSIDLLERYFTWKNCHLPRKNYDVFYSNELLSKIENHYVASEYLSTIQVIKNDLENAVDMNPRLSKKINKIKSNDAMLYDWNIYHFHLKNTKKNPNQYFYCECQ